jgi:hypothetical protein
MKARIHDCELPPQALLRRYSGKDGYTDCYFLDVPGAVTQADYIAAFYTTWVFKLERALLSWFASRPSTDVQAHELAHAQRTSFAAWTVESREDDQLLLCDFLGNTRSWLMTVPASEGVSTRLFFGSAVVARVDRRTGDRKMGFTFRALLGFHKIYSRVLLAAAARRLRSLAPEISDTAPL